MKDKYIYFGILIFFIILCLVNYFANSSFAYEYSNYNYNLFYKEDKKELSNDIEKYLNDINKYIFRNSNYEVYNNLNDNYEFMTNFAIDLIVDNYERYEDEIVELDNYSYLDKYNNVKNTNKYIDIDAIYNVTYKYFGVKDYNITNENVNIINNFISLSKYSDDKVDMIVDNINISEKNNYVSASVNYGDEINYEYLFYIKDNVLRLYNVEVMQ